MKVVVLYKLFHHYLDEQQIRFCFLQIKYFLFIILCLDIHCNIYKDTEFEQDYISTLTDKLHS